MKATDAPTIQQPGWNQYRSRVIAAATDAEALMQQLGKGVDSECLTELVAERLGVGIGTQENFDRLHQLVKAVRHVAREALRATRQESGGQYSLPFL